VKVSHSDVKDEISLKMISLDKVSDFNNSEGIRDGREKPISKIQ